MSRAETPEERAERILTELRQATADAAGAAKDLERATRQARAQIDDYMGPEVVRVTNAYIAQVQAQLDQWQRDMAAEISKRLVAWTAVIENDISRERIVHAAAEHVAAEVSERLKKAGHDAIDYRPAIVVQLCERAHKD